ncbi:unnamed protein product [Toxocara canis]|uniref:Cecropin-P2 n=1 Tax=Toxocara canis TaxID=6265 RepID=A0A3P7IRV5_TOXCA|nr:unnamed protein product [Toxocara canis]
MLVMFVTRQALLCIFLIYLLAQSVESSWWKKTYNKLENSAKKRIAEGIAIAIRGGRRRRRFIAEPSDILPNIEKNEPYVRAFQ